MKFTILLSLLPLLVSAAPTLEPVASQLGPAITNPHSIELALGDQIDYDNFAHSFEKRLIKETYYVDLFDKNYMWVLTEDTVLGTSIWSHQLMLAVGGPSYSSAAPKSSSSAVVSKSSSSIAKPSSSAVKSSASPSPSKAVVISASIGVSVSKPAASSVVKSIVSAIPSKSVAVSASVGVSVSKPAASSVVKSIVSAVPSKSVAVSASVGVSVSKPAASSVVKSIVSAVPSKSVAVSASVGVSVSKPAASSVVKSIVSTAPSKSVAISASVSAGVSKSASSSVVKSSAASVSKPASSSVSKAPASSTTPKSSAASVSKPASSSVSKAPASSSAIKSSSSVKPPTSTTSSSAPIVSASVGVSLGVSAADQAKFLTLHNDFRTKYSAGAVTWDDSLAAFALKTAQTCKYGHTGGPNGENIAAGVGGGYNIDSAFASWANEDALYNFALPGYSPATGHFTQIVWKGTTKIGCAAASCPDNSIFSGYRANSTYVVCEYQTPGNIVSSNADRTAQLFTSNVGPKVGSGLGVGVGVGINL